MARGKIELSGKKIRLDALDMKGEVLDRKEYEAHLARLQVEMLRVQQAYFHDGRRAIIVFEGWDAAGKGGTIRRLTERLDPRGCHVWPIAAPKREEQSRHYLWRFWQRLPEAGGIAIFDRSWYGRVLVERVEGFAAKDEWKRAYDEINEFERLLTDDGVRIVKLFLHITPEEQLKRFEERLRNPYKRWKLTEEDLRNRDKWDAYQTAIEDMFDKTSTKAAPWVALPANHKWFVRTRVLETVTSALAKGIRLTPPPVDPGVVALAESQLGLTVDDGDFRSGKARKEKKKD